MQKINLDLFKQYLISRLNKGVSNGQKLFFEIKDQGFQGSYASLYRYLRRDLSDYWKKQYKKSSQFRFVRSSINLTKYKRAIRFETEPGEQAQVDWGHFGKVLLNGKIEKLYCFVFVLGYSRTLYIEFTTSQKLPVFETCHINAFRTLGIPDNIVYDNTKTVIISNEKLPDGNRHLHFNLGFQDFSSYYGFNIIASPPYWPRNKGKVESSVKYVRNNFMQGVLLKKSIKSLEELNQQAKDWINKVANQRIHSTTNARPKDRWLKEKSYLRFPNNLPNYQVSPFLVRFSTKDQFIQYKQNFYSVPKEYAWRKLFIREVDIQGNQLVNIYFQDQLIAQHNLCSERGKSIENALHFKKDLTKHLEVNINPSNSWKNYPEIAVRPFEFYDRIINKN